MATILVGAAFIAERQTPDVSVYKPGNVTDCKFPHEHTQNNEGIILTMKIISVIKR